MAHKIEDLDNPVFVGDAAWHRLGTTLPHDKDLPAREALELSKLDWRTDLEPIRSINGDVIIPGHFATVRSDLSPNDVRRYLGVVGDKYTPVHNEEAFEVADILRNQFGARIETCGSLKNGKLVWMMVSLPTPVNIKDDRIHEYFLLMTSHDGTKRVTMGFTMVRVVCWNTLTMALNGLKDSISVPHTKTAPEKMKWASAAMVESKLYFGKLSEMFTKWANETVDRRFVKAYLEAIFPDPVTKDGKEPKRNRNQNVRDEITTLFNGKQIGAAQDATNGTAYGLFNAVTEYVDYDRSTRQHNGRQADDSRLESTWFGSGATLRSRAGNLLERALVIKSNPEKMSDLVLSVN